MSLHFWTCLTYADWDSRQSLRQRYILMSVLPIRFTSFICWPPSHSITFSEGFRHHSRKRRDHLKNCKYAWKPHCLCWWLLQCLMLKFLVSWFYPSFLLIVSFQKYFFKNDAAFCRETEVENFRYVSDTERS